MTVVKKCTTTASTTFQSNALFYFQVEVKGGFLLSKEASYFVPVAGFYAWSGDRPLIFSSSSGLRYVALSLFPYHDWPTLNTKSVFLRTILCCPFPARHSGM